MSDVINFPTKTVREWSSLEKTMRETIEKGGATESFANHVIERMKIAYPKFQVSYNFSFSLPEGESSSLVDQLTEFKSCLNEYNNNLLLDRLILEIELAIAQGIE